MSAATTTSQGRFAVRLFAATALLFAAAGSVMGALVWSVQPPRSTAGTFIVPGAFAFSTVLLAACSIWLQRALGWVKLERQAPFRRSMLGALGAGTLFVGVQGFGLWCIVQNLSDARNAGETQLGATALVMGAAVLHALHVSVALMFLSYVTLRAFADRYDHEYSFGVTVCAAFWHALGALWAVILAVYLLVSQFLR